MLKIITSARFRVGLVMLVAGFGVVGAALAGPIGYLQIEGEIEVKSSGYREGVRVSDNNFTVFSGDRIHTRRGAAVLVLSSGGTLGLGPGSEASVTLDSRSRTLELDLADGTLLYSLPGDVWKFSVVVNEFLLSSSAGNERAIQVGRDEQARIAGQVVRLEDGHIRVSVRNGQMLVQAGSGSRYQVSAGNEIGLLARSPSVEKVSSDKPTNRYFRIESPEQVGTRENFRIRWEMPDPPEEGYITIAPADSDPESFESMVSITEGQEIEFEAPGSPGDYEIRYIDAETGIVTNFVYLRVVGDRVVAPWYTTRTAIAGIGFASGLTTSYLICDCGDDDPDPVSP